MNKLSVLLVTLVAIQCIYARTPEPHHHLHYDGIFKKKKSELEKQSQEYLDDVDLIELEHNDLKSVPDIIKRLQHLETLDLSDNKLVSLKPKGSPRFPVLENLRILDLSGNELTTDSLKDLPSMPNLEHLNLSNNKIQSLKYLKNYPTLKTLDLSNNKLTSESLKDLISQPEVRILNLESNDIVSIVYLKEFPCLVVLDLGGNGRAGANKRLGVAETSIKNWKKLYHSKGGKTVSVMNNAY